jgi:hypothetical protein
MQGPMNVKHCPYFELILIFTEFRHLRLIASLKLLLVRKSGLTVGHESWSDVGEAPTLDDSRNVKTFLKISFSVSASMWRCGLDSMPQDKIHTLI